MARYVLAIVAGPATGRELELDAALELGRDADHGLGLGDDSLLSRRHVGLAPHEDGVLVTDLGSRNGTVVREARIAEPTLARPGDRIVVGETAFEVREVREARERAAETSLAVPVAQVPVEAEYVLELIRGPGTERLVPLTGALEIGREPSLGLVLDDEQVSRRHARIAVGDDGVLVEDLESRNGTLVNGRRIRRPTIVQPGDLVTIGETALELRRVREPAETPATAEAPAARRGWTFALTAAALFMAVLDNLVVTFALPDISADLGASLEALEWTVNGFALPFAVFLLTGAALGDRFGRRRMFAAGIALFTTASAVCALAPNVEVLVAARAAQGCGAALILPLSLTLLSAAFPDEKRGLALGAWSAIAGMAVAIGPPVGGLLVTAFSWEWIFWINVPIGIALVPLALLRLRESFGPQTRLDLVGAVLVSVGLAGIIAGVARGGAEGWGHVTVIGPILAGLALTAAFAAWERRAPAPMLALHLFRSRAFTAANASCFAMFFGVFGTIFLLSQFLQVVQGYSALEAGVRSLAWTGMPILFSPLAGILAERFGGGRLMAGGLAAQAVAVGWLAAVLSPDVPYSALLFPFVVGGIGMSFFFAPAAHVILGAVRPEEEGQASGLTNAVRQLGAVFGIAVLTTIFISAGSAGRDGFTDGLVAASAVGAVAIGIAFVAALAIPAHRPEGERAPVEASLGLGSLTPVTSHHAIVNASEAAPVWELRSVPVDEADSLEPDDWEPFAVAQDRLYLRRIAGRPAQDVPDASATVPD